MLDLFFLALQLYIFMDVIIFKNVKILNLEKVTSQIVVFLPSTLKLSGKQKFHVTHHLSFYDAECFCQLRNIFRRRAFLFLTKIK